VEDFFAPVATTTRAVPPAPHLLPQRRRLPPRFWLANALGLLTGTVLLLTVVRPGLEAPPELQQVREPAAASAGWGPSWVDALGRPGRWDPCTPIAYVVNPAHAPQTGRADLAEALRRLAAVSGLQFTDAGDTDEAPRRDRAAYQPERYGERWAPLLVAWSPPAATDVGIGGGTKGVALTVAVPGEQGPSILTGQVVLDADQRLASGFGPGTTEGEVLQHELAHAVGLGHVDDPTQVMYWRTTHSESEFGAGDRAGLAALGAAAGCLPAPRPGPLDTGA
jgi:hypothetical protein